MNWNDVWAWFVGAPLRIALILIGALLLQGLSRIIIRRVINRSIRRSSSKINRRETVGAQVDAAAAEVLLQERQVQRVTAVGSLLRSVATVVIWAIAITMILETLNVDIAPLLASAGIVGIAIGFGAQSLVKDYFSGISLILEDQFGVGDVVEINAVEGTVEEVALRVTRLRDKDGVVWYLRNGEILRVANMSQGWSMASVTVSVRSSADLEDVARVINEMGEALFADEQRSAILVSAPKYEGVELVSGDVTLIRIKARTEPGERLSGGRTVLEAAKRALDEAGIALPTLEEIRDAEL